MMHNDISSTASGQTETVFVWKALKSKMWSIWNNTWFSVSMCSCITLEIELWMLCIFYLQRLILTTCKDHLKMISDANLLCCGQAKWAQHLCPVCCGDNECSDSQRADFLPATIHQVLGSINLGNFVDGPMQGQRETLWAHQQWKTQNTSRIARNPFVDIFLSLAFKAEHVHKCVSENQQ